MNSRGIEFGERAALNATASPPSPAETVPTPRQAIIDANARRQADDGDRRPRRAGIHRRGAARRPSTRARGMLEQAADLLEQRARALHRAAAARGRQDARRCAFGSPRGRRFLPLLRRAGPQAVRRRRDDAGPDRREQRAAAARPRRIRRDLAVEFSAGDLSRPGHGGADGRQCRGRQARRADAADRGGSGAPAARGRRAGVRAASRAGRRPASARRWWRIPISPASSSPARPRSRASINRALAAKDGPIVPLIAETGGINAMIVDATALPEQVADDVVTSAFRSAGQRCSALRLLFVQDDVADRMIEMIAGAARELTIGDPARSRHPCRPGDRRRGQAAAGGAYRAHEAARPACISRAPRPHGNYVAPHIFELADAGQLTEEVFGPVLHVVRYPRRPARPRAAIDRAHRLRADARHPLPHRRHGRGT